MLGDTYFCCHLEGFREGEKRKTMRYLLLVDTCFVLSPLVEGAACTINTFHACGLRSVGKELDGLDWIDIYIENAGSFFLVAI